jgi:hypothetical protein
MGCLEVNGKFPLSGGKMGVRAFLFFLELIDQRNASPANLREHNVRCREGSCDRW